MEGKDSICEKIQVLGALKVIGVQTAVRRAVSEAADETADLSG